jgi:hypothetical protein
VEVNKEGDRVVVQAAKEEVVEAARAVAAKEVKVDKVAKTVKVANQVVAALHLASVILNKKIATKEAKILNP